MRPLTATFAAVLLLTISSRAGAQTVYLAAADTAYYTATNPYFMYWLDGADSLGGPVVDRSVEAQLWSSSGDRLAVHMRSITVGVRRSESTQVFELDPRGRVLTIDGEPAGLNQRVDLVPVLPVAGDLAVGTTWSDTLGPAGAEADGGDLFTIVRTSRVTRFLDTLGARVAEIESEGRVQYRHRWHGDSAGAARVWLDVAGPMQERSWIDLVRGRLVARTWTMDLRGIGGNPYVLDRDSVPAGLRSAQTTSPLAAAEARFLLRPLPAGDTTMTATPAKGAILLHTVARQADTVASSMVRNDGMVGTVRATYRAGRTATYEALWTDSLGNARRQRVDVDGDRLRVVGSSGDTTYAAPAEGWAIADYAMSELLVPLVLALPHDGQAHSVQIYRPYPAVWDSAMVTIRAIDSALIAIVSPARGAASVLFLTPQGDLLLDEKAAEEGSGEPFASQRVAPPGSARRAHLERLLAMLQSAE